MGSKGLILKLSALWVTFSLLSLEDWSLAIWTTDSGGPEVCIYIAYKVWLYSFFLWVAWLAIILPSWSRIQSTGWKEGPWISTAHQRWFSNSELEGNNSHGNIKEIPAHRACLCCSQGELYCLISNCKTGRDQVWPQAFLLLSVLKVLATPLPPPDS